MQKIDLGVDLRRGIPLTNEEINAVVGSYDHYTAAAYASMYYGLYGNPSNGDWLNEGAESWYSVESYIVDYDYGVGGGWAVFIAPSGSGYEYGVTLDPNGVDK